jgi:hypothetical protein
MLADEAIEKELDQNVEEQQLAEDRKLNRLASIRDFINFLDGSKDRRESQRKLKGKDPAKAGFGYISDSEEYYGKGWNEFGDDGEEAFSEHQADKQPDDLATGFTRISRGTLVEKIRRIDRLAGNTDVDTDEVESEEEADWMLSDDELEGGGSSEVDGDILNSDDEDDADDEEEILVKHVPIPGFQKPIRRSARLEGSQRMLSVREIGPAIGKHAETVTSLRMRRK